MTLAKQRSAALLPAELRPAELRSGERRWLWALGLYIGLALLATWIYRGPAPRYESVGDGTGSGVSSLHAIETLGILLGEKELRHPAGSVENQFFRVRLLGQLDSLGLATRVLPLHDEDGSRAGMANVIAHVPGEVAARPILLVTHYDSCPYGPGAGDAGQCVAAVLEALRVLKTQPLRHGFWVVFTDGEERGMWGARDLVARTDLPWGEAIPLVINFDARGDRGAALLYETHKQNLAAMKVAANSIARPRATTSLMINVYEKQPNATDYTIFRKADWPGWNFAVIAGAENYHTPSDDLTHLSPRSIGHFAEHALALLRRIDEMPASEIADIEKSEPAVFFDVLGQFVVLYPASWNWWHLVAAITLLVAAVGLRSESVHLRAKSMLRIFGLLVVTVIASALAGWVMTATLRWSDMLPRRFVPYSDLICLIYVVIGVVAAYEVSRRIAAVGTRAECFVVIQAAAIVLGTLACSVETGGAYLCLWPSLFWGILLLAEVRDGLRKKLGSWLEQWLGVIGCTLPALLFAPTYVLLAQALGPHAGLILAGVVVIMLAPTALAWASLSSRSQSSRSQSSES